MIKDALKFVLGLQNEDCQIFEQLLKKLGKNEQVEQHMQQLPPDVIEHIHNNARDNTDGVIDDPEDPDNTNLAQYYNKHKVDGWDPKQDREDSQIHQNLLPNVTSASDYPVPKQNSMSESHKPSFLQYISEQYSQPSVGTYNAQQNPQQPQQPQVPINTAAQIDAQLANVGGDGTTRAIDPVIQKQIDSLEAAGNHIAADQLRQRALRTAKIVNGPKTPADAIVASRKKQLSQAILAAQQQKQAAQVQQIQHPTNQQNNIRSTQPNNQQGNPNAIR